MTFNFEMWPIYNVASKRTNNAGFYLGAPDNTKNYRDYCDNEQNMNKATCDVVYQERYYPNDDQNHRDKI